jgi:sialic acid synthase SpsE
MTQTNETLWNGLESASRIYVIAEAGLDHGLTQEKALAFVRAAKWSGADAVKFQTVGLEADLPRDIFRTLCKETKRIGIELVSTAFDEESADFFDGLGVTAFNIASGDIARRPLIEHISSKRKPMLLSTRMSRDEEIRDAIDWMHRSVGSRAVLLHCVSSSAKLEDLNVRMVEYLRDHFSVLIGFSDPGARPLSSIVAASLGAQVIERRFILETRYETADMSLSMDTKQLKHHIEELRSIRRILGEPGKSPLSHVERRRAAKA